MRLAAPSVVWPEGLAGNCRKLALDWPEVGLALYELESCLNYGPDDLSPDLDGLGLRYHLHLPLDLPWRLGAEAVFQGVLKLLGKTAYLAPWGYVLHPPEDLAALEKFARLWLTAGLSGSALLLENVAGRDLLREWPLIERFGLSACLDLGHLLAFAQEGLLAAPGLWTKVRLCHVYAPCDPARPDDLEAIKSGGHRHRPLNLLDERGEAVLRLLLERASPETVWLFEVFKPEDLRASLAWFEHATLGKADAQAHTGR